MIYLDSSVVLAWLLSEDRVPPAAIWQQELVSSRLLEFEVWNRLHARGLEGSIAASEARMLLPRLVLLDLAPPVIGRALEPFPLPVRTLDALHLASADFLRRQGEMVEVASYDRRLRAAALALGLPLYDV